MEKITLEEFEEKVTTTSHESVIVFSADWCGPCKQLSKMIGTLDPQNQLRVYKIDVDTEGKLAEMFNVRSIPSVFKVKEGVTVDSFIGLPQPQTLKEFLGVEGE